jgi:hypothetical protein
MHAGRGVGSTASAAAATTLGPDLEAYVTRVRSRLTQPQAAFGEDVDREDSINPDGRISICLESEGFSEPDERARIDLLFGGALMCSSRTGPRL